MKCVHAATLGSIENAGYSVLFGICSADSECGTGGMRGESFLDITLYVAVSNETGNLLDNASITVNVEGSR